MELGVKLDIPMTLIVVRLNIFQQCVILGWGAPWIINEYLNSSNWMYVVVNSNIVASDMIRDHNTYITNHKLETITICRLESNYYYIYIYYVINSNYY